VCVLKNGRKAIAGSQTGTLALFDYGNWEEHSDRFPGHPSSIDCIVKVDEDTILTGSSDGIIRIIGVLPNKMLGVVGEHGDMPVERMALSCDRSALATASHDSTIKLWDVKYLWEEGSRSRMAGDEDDARAELGDAAVSDSDSDSDSEDAGKRKRKNKESAKKSKMQGSGEARAVAKKQAAKKFFDGL
jgi:WD40 repeat protein|tara:strand:+ start:2814 stop:3377 length:564 start_codon:yes stop_codon:yes gene_type:complete